MSNSKKAVPVIVRDRHGDMLKGIATLSTMEAYWESKMRGKWREVKPTDIERVEKVIYVRDHDIRRRFCALGFTPKVAR